MKTTSIMIVGVGGQGTLLASKLLGNVLIGAGYDVKLSEVHGMSQRGGSVVTYVRYGDKVYSPIVDQGEADYILSFEILESARWISYLKKGGKLITNTQKTWPMPVITGAMPYPENIVEKLSAMADVQAVDALALATRRAAPRPSTWCSSACSRSSWTSPRQPGSRPSKRPSPRNSSSSTKRPSPWAGKRKRAWCGGTFGS